MGQQTTEFVHDRIAADPFTGQAFTYAQHKLDGWRGTFFVQPCDACVPLRCYGRNEDTALEFMARFPRLWEHPTIKKIQALPPCTSVDVEITAEGALRHKVTTALRDPAAPIHITAFAVPWFEGNDCRTGALEAAEGICLENGIPFAPFLNAEPWANALSTIEIRETLLNTARELGIEGWVLKSGGQYGKWYKLKLERTVDAFIVGVRPGRGKYTGMVGSLELAVYDDDSAVRVIANASGMTDEQRQEMTRLRDLNELVDRVVEVKYQMVGSAGRLVHPRFMRWRDDKRATACDLTQLTA